MKTKGEAEEAIKALGFPTTVILRPGLLDRGDSARWVEKALGFFSAGVPVGTVARAMRLDAEAAADAAAPATPVVRLLTDKDIRRVGTAPSS